MPWKVCGPVDEGLRFIARPLACEGRASTKSKFAISVFECTFREFGLPAAIRTDNGVPFAAPWALSGLSRLAVWWLRLGIGLQRIESGHPQQNGRYERPHQALGGAYPAEVHTPSARPYEPPQDPD